MGTIDLVLAMLAAVVVSAGIVRMLPLPVPTPLVQIALGAAVAALPNEAVELDPDIFFLLFLPPLLFLAGWRISNESLRHDKGVMLQLAIGLVFFTVVGMGFLIHWLIPAMPLAVAFALAAVLSPTDPIAVSAITERSPLPRRMAHVLEGESLLNDASGLVCFRFAVAAAITGTFSLSEAALTFLWIVIGGLVIGIALTFGITVVKSAVSRRFGEVPGSQVLISLLMPFAAYQLADRFGCSGVLAAVAAGITTSYVELSGRVLAITRMQRTAVWDTVHFALNGVMFVLLGEQLPGILSDAVDAVAQSHHRDPLWLAIYVAAITAALVFMRFAWVWIAIHLRIRLASDRPGTDAYFRPRFRLVAAVALAGTRGALTLAAVLSLPMTLPNGSDFPARELAVFIAAGVIILWLIAASAGLPALLRGLNLPVDHGPQAQEDLARTRAAHAAIRSIEERLHDLAEDRGNADVYSEAASRVMDLYRRRIDGARLSAEDAERVQLNDRIERELRLAGLHAERDTIFALARASTISNECSHKLIREIDLLEERMGA